ncbi:MAG TPA: biopolymer transporter ExbD, partial [Candidatus Acidoferrales bacterium]|nr:biopolymer transporter ExbD [Candidatus Acidoferrales bacterium]
QLALPASRQALRPGVNENPPQVVTISSNGTLYLGTRPFTLEGLQGQLMEIAAKNPKVKLAVRADKNAPWGRMVEVMDAAKAANIKDIAAFTKEEGKQ